MWLGLEDVQPLGIHTKRGRHTADLEANLVDSKGCYPDGWEGLTEYSRDTKIPTWRTN